MAARKGATRPARNRGPATPDWTQRFLDELRTTRMVTAACHSAGVGRSTVYERRGSDPAFAERWAEIDLEITDALEREAFRRAAIGTERGVYYQGEEVAREREFSDTLLIFLLKARKPKTYRENVRLEHTGEDGGPVVIDVLGGKDPAAVSPATRRAIARELEKETTNAGRGGTD